MDKVKLALKFLKKQHFWFLLGLVVIISAYSWWSARGALMAAFLKDKSEIEDRKGKARNVSGIPSHPNADHHKKEDEYIASYTQDVAKAWTINFDKQGTDILTWPAELRADFIDQVKDLRPIETKLADPKFRELATKFLERYRNYIQNELPKLAEIVGAKWSPTETAGAGGGELNRNIGGPGGNVSADNKTYLVEWLPADQEKWKTGHFDWSKKSTQLPTTREVLYAQEDLWVLKALLTIIKNVNGKIDQPHLSTIKTIDFIHIGREAAKPEGTVAKLKPGEAGAPGMGGEGLRPGGPAGLGPGGPGPAAVGGPGGGVPPAGPGVPGMGREGMGMGVGAQGETIGDNRYVDDKYLPLTAAQLTAIGQTTDQAAAHLAVAKRMPVRMRVQMDTRKVHKLLTECANSPLTVEVRQLRVNPDKATKGSGAGAGGAFGGGEGGGVRSDASGQAGGKTVTPYDGTVEIYGIIYVYNPVPTALAAAMNEDIVAAGGEAKTDAGATPAPAGSVPAPAPGGAAAPAPGLPAPAAGTPVPATGAPAAEKTTPAPDASKAGAPGAAPAPAGAAPAPATGAPAAVGEAKAEEKKAPAPSADDLNGGPAPGGAAKAEPVAPAKN